VRIADGDCAGLSSALITGASQASASATTILLARNGTYASCHVTFSSDNSANAITIDGQGAELQYPVINAAGGSLTLRNISIRPSVAASAPLTECVTKPYPMASFICTSGDLTLDTVSITNLKVPSEFFGTGGIAEQVALILSYGSGSLVLRNVTIANLSMVFDPTQSQYTSFPSVIVDLASDANLEIYNSTFTNLDFFDFPAPLNSSILYSAHPAKIANSLFAGPMPDCAGPAQSLGGNVFRDPDCGPTASDKVVGDANLGTLDNHGGSVPTQALTYGSPARGAGVAQYCEAVDARGYTRAPNGCDAGAYEYGGGAGALTANGMNGVYYDPNANGHYVSIQRIHDNGDIAILWSTFDQRGNQAWIYGVGQLSGKHIHAAMSQNVGGVLQVGGPATGSTVRPWGTVDIDLTSCLLAQFNYQSSVANFGSGQFPLTRLALVSDFGCSN
jgi:hypothetical protein